MNTRRGPRVGVHVPGARFMIAILLAVALGACVEVNGGAVELSWTLRSFEGNPIADGLAASCARVKIDRIRLRWEAASEDTQPSQGALLSGSADFDCTANRGVTDFVLAEGDHLLWIVPICEDNMPAETHTYEVPPPIRRTVGSGEIVTLNSLLVVAEDCSVAGKDSGCTCVPESVVPGSS